MPARPHRSVSGAVGPLRSAAAPDDRVEVGRKFKVGEYEGYIHVGLFEDGTPGDIFVDIAKEGTTLAGLMNSFMISVSLGLQYGVPLEVYVSKFSHMRFEPSGMTNDADIESRSRSWTTSSAGWARSSSPPTSRKKPASSPQR